MQFLKTLLAIVLAVMIAVFALANRQPVDVNLWGGLVWSPPLGYLVLFVFLLGWLPAWLLHVVSRWSLGRRIERTEQQLESERTLNRTPPVATPTPVSSGSATPPPGDSL